MKHLNSLIAFFLFTTAILFVGCSDDDDPEKPIVVDNKEALTQNVYADKTEGNGVSFVTTGPWTSSIKIPASSRSTSESPDWVSITPNSGSKAGNYTIAINLEPNKTGSDRSATITINCEGTEITINVTQKGTKEDGTVLARTISFKVFSCNDKWTPENNTPYLIADKAEVKVYKGETLEGTYITDANGVAEAKLEDGEYGYIVTRGEEKNLFREGVIIDGIFTSEENVWLGNLKFRDTNGDGTVNEEDAVDKVTITVSKDESIDVYIAPDDFTPTYEVFDLSKVMGRIRAKHFPEILKESYLIDASMTREAALEAPYNTFMNFSFDASSTPVSSLWDKAYALIKDVNWLYENIDDLPGMSPEANRGYKSQAAFYRIYAYSLLINYFGDVPIYTTSSFESIPKNTIPEVVNYIFDQGDFIAANVGGYDHFKYSAFQIMARTAINTQDFNDSYNLTARIIDSGKYNLRSDGSCDAVYEEYVFTNLPEAMRKYELTNPTSLPLLYYETLLLHAEAALGIGQNIEAIQIVNQFAQADGKAPVFPNGGATTEEIRNAIASIWKEKLDREGHTFARLKRNNIFLSTLGSYGAKEKHLLLPIPTSALSDKIKQNSGW